MLNLNKLFDDLSEESYVIIKIADNFPNYKVGDDLDILCRDLELVSKIIINFISDYVNAFSKLQIHNRSSTHVQIDFTVNKKINIRFDLFAALPSYERTKFKPSYFDIIIESCRFATVQGCTVKVPNFIDDCILRYAEFNEYFGDRADKIKHIDFILKNIDGDDASKKKFFVRLHHFLSFQESSPERPLMREHIMRQRKYFVLQIEKVNLVLREQGIRILLRKIYDKLVSR